jgi:hypothetical protein
MPDQECVYCQGTGREWRFLHPPERIGNNQLYGLARRVACRFCEGTGRQPLDNRGGHDVQEEGRTWLRR